MQSDPFPVVALVGSAGGLEAVVEVVSRLPANFGAAVIVLIHLDPEHRSLLTEIIAPRSKLPVTTAEDGMQLEPGHMLVVPSATHLLVAREGEILKVVRFVSGAYPPSRPSADLLLATLATGAGRRAIAVILSGGGHDGATGATAVHACGGTVLATDETSSGSFSMPLAAIEREHAVDRVLPLREIAGALEARVDTG